MSKVLLMFVYMICVFSHLYTTQFWWRAFGVQKSRWNNLLYIRELNNSKIFIFGIDMRVYIQLAVQAVQLAPVVLVAQELPVV